MNALSSSNHSCDNCAGDPEPIEVCRIRLMQAAGTCAVVSEFRTADAVLDRWVGRERGRVNGKNTRSPARREFDFEITFVDGYTFCGCYEFWRGARRRPSLTQFVRGLFAAHAPSDANGAVDLSRYAIHAS